MDRRLRFVFTQAAWMVGTVFALLLLDVFTLSLFFIISYIGLLIIIELTAPFVVTPSWRLRLRWLVLLGFFVFVSILAQRILALLPSGTF